MVQIPEMMKTTSFRPSCGWTEPGNTYPLWLFTTRPCALCIFATRGKHADPESGSSFSSTQGDGRFRRRGWTLFYERGTPVPIVAQIPKMVKTTSFHQQPEVNYLPRFSPQLIFPAMYTLSMYIAGETNLLENLDIVHITWLVVRGRCRHRLQCGNP